jgi:hypothetical protein
MCWRETRKNDNKIGLGIRMQKLRLVSKNE